MDIPSCESCGTFDHVERWRFPGVSKIAVMCAECTDGEADLVVEEDTDFFGDEPSIAESEPQF